MAEVCQLKSQMCYPGGPAMKQYFLDASTLHYSQFRVAVDINYFTLNRHSLYFLDSQMTLISMAGIWQDMFLDPDR